MKDTFISLDLNTIKSVHGEKFFELRSIINSHDPVNLLSIGAPDDEYEPEVKTIIAQLHVTMLEQEVLDLVHQEFIRWFDDESTVGTKEAYKALAKDIYQWLLK